MAWKMRFGWRPASTRRRSTIGPRATKPGRNGAGVAGAVDQRVPGVAVGGDGGHPDRAVLVADLVRLLQAGGALRDGVRVRGVDVRHLEREVDDAVAVAGHVLGAVGVRADRAVQHEAGRAAGQHVRRVVAVALLGPAVGDAVHAEGGRSSSAPPAWRCRRRSAAASMPLTGNGSRLMSWSTAPTRTSMSASSVDWGRSIAWVMVASLAYRPASRAAAVVCFRRAVAAARSWATVDDYPGQLVHSVW